ncbi:GL18199 [Drosophila persimilis]|uniref:GL18199 n=1 Tax=Drosophila persimilis TaxID=7234 RepID=B4HBB9_DROPE|nr:GL18199 [Drosophila persimilis]
MAGYPPDPAEPANHVNFWARPVRSPARGRRPGAGGSNNRDPRRTNPGPAPTTSAAAKTAETQTAETATAAQTATAEAAATAATAPTEVELAEVEAWERGPWVWPAPERSTAAERPALKRQASCPKPRASHRPSSTKAQPDKGGGTVG